MTTISSASTALLQSLQNLQTKLTSADTDGNGSLSASEFAAAAKIDPNLTGGSGSTAAAEFKKLDANGDGSVTSQELTAGINLNTQVQAALLQGQELASGSEFLQLLSGSSSSSSSSLFGSSGSNDFSSLTSSLLGGGSTSSTLTSLLSGGNANTTTLAGLLGGGSGDTSSTDTYTALLQQLVDSYNTTSAATSTTGTTGTAATTKPVDTTA